MVVRRQVPITVCLFLDLRSIGMSTSMAVAAGVQAAAAKRAPAGSSYGGFLVKRIVSDGTSFSELSECHLRRCVHHPGRPLWSDLSVCKLVSGGTRCSVPCCPIRGAGGVWRAGPILTAAYLSHSPVRCTAHPDGCQASGANHRLPVSRSAFNRHVHIHGCCRRRSGGCGEACAGWQLVWGFSCQADCE